MDMNLDLSLGPGSRETAQAAFTGSRYYRTNSGIYLKDFGRGDSDDSAKLYSGQMLSFDGVDDYVDTGCKLVNGDDFTICATCQRPNATNDGGYVSFSGISNSINYAGNYYFDVYVWDVLQGTYIRWRNSFAFLGISNDEIFRVVVSVPNGSTPCVYINGVDIGVAGLNPTTNVSTGLLTGKPVRIGYTDPNYLDGFIGNVQIWNAAFDADDVEYDYLNCYQNLTADNRPGTSLASANLKGHWPLIAGSGDVAYDWSGNGNHGALTNFPTDDSQWSNASALDSPLVIQTALCEWALKDSNNACVPLDTVDSTNFTRDYFELNFNGRSVAYIGMGVDVSPTTAVIFEYILSRRSLLNADSYILYKLLSFYLRIGRSVNALTTQVLVYSADGDLVYISRNYDDDSKHHFVVTYDSRTGELKYWFDGSLVGTDTSSDTDKTIRNNSNPVYFMNNSLGTADSEACQIPLFKIWIDSEAQAIIDDDLEAWVAKRYAKSAAKYNL